MAKSAAGSATGADWKNWMEFKERRIAVKQLGGLRPCAAAFLLTMAMAVTTSALSFFVSPVCGDLGIGRGSFTVYFSLMTASGALSASFLGQYIHKNGVRKILLIAGFWCFAGLMLFSVSNALWMFYLVGAAMGVFGTGCMNLCAGIIVQTSYSGERAAGLLGFVMAGSGAGGMVFSMILPGALERFGWRMSYRVLAVCWLVLVMAAFFLSGKQEATGTAGNRKTAAAGMTRDEALKSPKFYLMLVAVLVYSMGCGIQQHLPAVLTQLEFSTAQVSVLMSAMTASLAVGKILQGMLYSKTGAAGGGTVITAFYIAGFLLLLKAGTAYAGVVSLAVGMGIVTTLMPTATRAVFGAREYAAIWGILAAASSAGSLIATPVWGFVYDCWGSYVPAMLVTPALILLALATMLLALRKKKC